MKPALLVFALLLTASPVQKQEQQRHPSFHIDFILYGTADAWRHSDAVVYLRIEDTKAWPIGRIAEFGGLSVLHSARVLDVVKGHPAGGPTGRTFTFVQAGSTDEPAYPKGDEFIAFLNWSDDVFVRSAGPSSVYAVKEGKVDWLNLGRDIPYSTETLTVEDFIARLKALPKGQVQGRVSGYVEDAMGAVLPGVGIALIGVDGKHSTVTDASGGYEVGNLLTGRYTLTAELAGFTTIRRDNIAVADGQNATIDFSMSPSGTVEIDWPVPAGGLTGLWNAADAVLRVRIERTARPEGRAFAEHTARTLEVFKWPALLSQIPSIVAFRQEQWVSEPAPYPTGQDMVLFLNLRRGIFYRASGWFGAFLVQGDHIQTVYPEVAPANMKVGDFVARLRALAKEGR